MNVNTALEFNAIFINDKEELTFMWCFSIKFEDTTVNEKKKHLC